MSDAFVQGASGGRADAGDIVLTLASPIAAGNALIVVAFVCGVTIGSDNQISTPTGGGVTWIGESATGTIPDETPHDGRMAVFHGLASTGGTSTVTVTVADGGGGTIVTSAFAAVLEVTGISSLLMAQQVGGRSPTTEASSAGSDNPFGQDFGPGVPFAYILTPQSKTVTTDNAFVLLALASRRAQLQTPVAGSPAVVDAIRTTGLFAAYAASLSPARAFRFGEGSGATMVEAGSLGNGAYNGGYSHVAGLLAGDSDGAIRFDGIAGSYGRISTTPPTLSNTFTVGVRFRRERLATAEVLVSQNGGFCISIDGQGRVGLGTGASHIYNTVPVVEDLLPHTVSVHKSGATTHIYVDGAETTVNLSADHTYAGGAANIDVARSYGGGSEFQGTIDELRLWTTSRTAAEAARLSYTAAAMLAVAYRNVTRPGISWASWPEGFGIDSWIGVGAEYDLTGPSAALTGRLDITSEVVGVFLGTSTLSVPAAPVNLPEYYVFGDEDRVLASMRYLMIRAAGADDHPPLRGSDSPFAGIPGEQHEAKLPGGRPLNLFLMVAPYDEDGSEPADPDPIATRANLDAIQAILIRRRQQRLIRVMPDGTGRVADAEVTQATVAAGASDDIAPVMYRLQMTLQLADPWFYTDAIVSGPHSFLTSPLTFTITNPGSAETRRVLIEVTGPSTGTQIVNLTNGVRLVLPNLTSSQRLILDAQAMLALLGGASAIGSVAHYGDAALMRLDPGDNVFQVSSSSPGGSIVISFRPAYV